MPRYSKSSLEKLEMCHPDLRLLFNRVIQIIDCSIIEGHRNEAEQNKAYTDGKSKLKYPDSKHNKVPSMAIDVVPYPIDWNDRERFYLLAGIVYSVSESLNIKIRWGGDWKRTILSGERTNSFDDLPHWELIE